MAHFDRYAALLAEWQGRMNLVGPATLPEVWTRHFADSAQLLPRVAPGPLVDMGAGAGFPGIVLALLGVAPVTLVEATRKKCAFLQAVVDELGLADRATVANARIEAMPAFAAATITARACKPLVQLFDWGLRFSTPETVWVLPKGATAAAEVADARRSFAFQADLIPSRTDAQARVVVAHRVERRR